MAAAFIFVTSVPFDLSMNCQRQRIVMDMYFYIKENRPCLYSLSSSLMTNISVKDLNMRGVNTSSLIFEYTHHCWHVSRPELTCQLICYFPVVCNKVLLISEFICIDSFKIMWFWSERCAFMDAYLILVL